MRLPLARTLLSCMLGALAGCEGYTYTLNDRTVFERAPLFADYAIADEALRACVEQAIEDARITRPGQLQDLNCSSAGIRSLAGLEVFSGLQRLGLDDNPLADLAALARLGQLELVQLRGTGLRGNEAGLCGTAPRQLALGDNDDFQCAELARLRECGATPLELPEQCAEAAH